MTAPTSASGPSAPPDVSGTSVGDLIGDISQDLSALMRQELELAKAEIKVEVTKAGKAVGMFGGAGFAGYMVLLFLSLGLWWGLADVMPVGWAAVVTAGVWAVIGAALALAGRSTLRTVNPKPERTIETARQVPDALTPSNGN
jgi:hypothetical protein